MAMNSRAFLVKTRFKDANQLLRFGRFFSVLYKDFPGIYIEFGSEMRKLFDQVQTVLEIFGKI